MDASELDESPSAPESYEPPTVFDIGSVAELTALGAGAGTDAEAFAS